MCQHDTLVAFDERTVRRQEVWAQILLQQANGARSTAASGLQLHSVHSRRIFKLERFGERQLRPPRPVEQPERMDPTTTAHLLEYRKGKRVRRAQWHRSKRQLIAELCVVVFNPFRRQSWRPRESNLSCRSKDTKMIGAADSGSVHRTVIGARIARQPG